MCYDVARLVAASLLCSWLGDEATRKLQARRGVAPCMRSPPPARLQRIRLESCGAQQHLSAVGRGLNTNALSAHQKGRTTKTALAQLQHL
jgi:hypothetical protein